MEKTNAKRLAMLAIFQKRSGIAKKDSNIEDASLTADDLWNRVRRIDGVMNTNIYFAIARLSDDLNTFGFGFFL